MPYAIIKTHFMMFSQTLNKVSQFSTTTILNLKKRDSYDLLIM